MHCPLPVTNQRNVLCVLPAYTPSFGTFSHAYRLLPRVRAFMPPQGLLVIAAYLPTTWPVRFVEENIALANSADFDWADVILLSGMHIQAPQIHDIARRAKFQARLSYSADHRFQALRSVHGIARVSNRGNCLVRQRQDSGPRHRELRRF
jgi:hopanoid C-2 methylase